MKKLERSEMKNLKGGVNAPPGPEVPTPGWCLGNFCFSQLNCDCWGPFPGNGVACVNNKCSHQ